MEINRMAVSNAKKLFLEKGIIKASVVRPEVILSWERSRLQERVVDNISHEVALPEKWLVSGSIKEIYDFMFSRLGDYTSFILDRGGNIVDSKLRHEGFHVPRSFIEGFAGTTAFSVTMKLSKPYEIFYDEHYKEFFSDYVSYCTKLPDAADLKYKKDLYLLLFAKDEIDVERVVRIMEMSFSGKFDEEVAADVGIPEYSSKAKAASESGLMEDNANRRLARADDKGKYEPYLAGISREIIDFKDRLAASSRVNKFLRIDSSDADESRGAISLCVKAVEEMVSVPSVELSTLAHDTDVSAWETEVAGSMDGESPLVIVIDSINRLPVRSQRKLSEVLQRLRKSPGEYRVIMSFHRGDTDDWIRETTIPSLHHLISCPKHEYPPVAVRTCDTPSIVREIVSSHGMKEKGRTEVTAEFLKGMEKCIWPGGVSQIRGYMMFILNASDSDIRLDRTFLPKAANLSRDRSAIRGAGAAVSNGTQKGGEASSSASPDLEQPSLQAGPGAGSAKTFDPGDSVDLKAVEKKAIVRALEISGGNVTEAARSLSIGRTTLYRKMKLYAIKG